jgi:hypothetical protein
MRAWLVAVLMALELSGTLAAQTAPQLQFQGQAYFGGSMTLHLTGTVGQPALLAYGLNPLSLDAPIQTGKGPWYVGLLVNLVPLGNIPGSGRLDLPFGMPPPMPALSGIPIVMQAYVPLQLSNPATLGLDVPFLLPQSATAIPSPNPTAGANFGDRVVAGDLNADGNVDLAVGAWFEDYLGIERSGRVYVLWGPDWTTYSALASPSPGHVAGFGASILIADLDNDSVDDLIVGEIVADPPTAPDTATLYVYLGGSPLDAPAFALQSPTTGIDAAVFGRHAVVGDFNSDTWPDLADSMGHATVAGFANAGMVTVYWGPSFSSTTIIANPTPTVGDYFGSSLAVADVDGDGIEDLVEGSGRSNLPGATQAGKIHVFSGPGMDLTFTIPNPLGIKNARFGEGLHAADLNADGKAEIIAADVKNRLFIFWEPDSSDYSVRTKPPSPYTTGESSFGYFIATTDANQDDIADIVIADPFEGTLTSCSPSAPNGGTVYISLGPYYATFDRIWSASSACGDAYSTGLITCDVNADGRQELLVGAPTMEVGAVSNAGAMYILWP